MVEHPVSAACGADALPDGASDLSPGERGETVSRAATVGTRTVFHYGDSTEELKRFAWFKANSPRGPHPVGEKPANAWGLCDLVGNVWEWCNDYYQEDYYQHSPERDPRGPATGQNRVVRGGCWNSKPEHCRAAYRYYEMPAYTDICFAKDLHGQIGFRCVKRLP